jgi:hypothetical protein
MSKQVTRSTATNQGHAGKRNKCYTVTSFPIGDVAFGLALRAVKENWPANKLGPAIAKLALEHKEERGIQWGLERALKNRMRIIEPRPNQLQLDIDSIGLLTFHEMQWSILEKAGITKGWKRSVKRSKRGGSHLHVTITAPSSFGENFLLRNFQTLNAVFRVGLQALLGSDPKREAFNLCRVLNGNKYPIVFFEKKK